MKTAILGAGVALALLLEVMFGAALLDSASFEMGESAGWCEALGCEGH